MNNALDPKPVNKQRVFVIIRAKWISLWFDIAV